MKGACHSLLYPSDGSDVKWTVVGPSLALMTETAPQRNDPLQELFIGPHWIVRAGAPWRMMPRGRRRGMPSPSRPGGTHDPR
jgi:transposase